VVDRGELMPLLCFTSEDLTSELMSRLYYSYFLIHVYFAINKHTLEYIFKHQLLFFLLALVHCPRLVSSIKPADQSVQIIGLSDFPLYSQIL